MVRDMRTTLQTALCIVIRMGAVLMAVGLLEQAPSVFLYPSQGGPYFACALWLTGASLVLAFMLWLSPNVLARWAVGRSSHQSLEIPIGADPIQRIAFSIVGAWLFIAGMTGLIARVVMMLVIFHRSAYGCSRRILSSRDWYWLVEHPATTVVGGCLVLTSAGLVGLLHGVRGYPGRAEKESVDDTGFAQDG